jgi:peptidoglycan biosynthesis protein MviN/MurJ (putative lipid II flippase)
MLGAATLGLVTLRVGSLFGASPRLDAYFVAVSLPAILLSLSAASVTSQVTPRLAALSADDARRKAGGYATRIIAVALALSAFIAAFSPQIVSVVAPRLSGSGAGLASDVLRIYAITITPTMAAHLYSAYGYARSRVWAGGVSTGLYGLVWLGLLFVGPFDHDVEGVAWAAVVATVVQLSTVFLACAPLRRLPWPTLRQAGRVKVIASVMTGSLIALLVARANLVLDPFFGASLGPGKVSELSYAYRATLLIILVCAQGPATAILVHAREAHEDRRINLRLSLLFACCAAVFVGLGFAPLAQPLLAHGKFSSDSAHQVGILVEYYAPAILLAALAWSLENTLNARGRVWTVACVSIPFLVVNIGLSALLVPTLGEAGRPIAVTLSMLTYALLLGRALRYSPEVRTMMVDFPWPPFAIAVIAIATVTILLNHLGRSLGGSAPVWSAVAAAWAGAVVILAGRAVITSSRGVLERGGRHSARSAGRHRRVAFGGDAVAQISAEVATAWRVQRHRRARRGQRE